MMSNSDTIMLYASILYRGREGRENNILFRVNIYIKQENINSPPINPLTPYSPHPQAAKLKNSSSIFRRLLHILRIRKQSPDQNLFSQIKINMT